MKNPSLAHREDFLRAQAEATRNLSATISQRYKDRLETCADDERVRVLFKIVELDRRNGYILSTSADKKSVLSVLPHIWVGDANERLKALEPGYKRRPVFTRKALAATATSAERDRNAIASLLQAHGSTAAAAGHTRPKSVYLSSLRMEEYQRLVDGKDIGCVGGESPTVDDETVQVVAQVLDDYGEQFGVASREGEVRLPPGVGVECR
ncbi:hypothetical protein DFJ73DRAFT_429819 [Zopfochytrium polystomum]|nr:hypothetical protein DFJ73DRAFT_429819 [Zopfochytrium polystomum]